MADSLAFRWRKALALESRSAPEFYTSSLEVEEGAHAEAIRFVLDLGLAAVFCIEGVPTIGFLTGPDNPLHRIDEVHQILWNQGLMSLLLVIQDDELTAYSLVKRPFKRERSQKSDPRLITTLSLTGDALKLRELIHGTESGRFWFEHDKYFDPDDRVDSVLLSNLVEAFRELRDELGWEASQALLMQTIFVAYLEDRKILNEGVFRCASETTCSSFAEILDSAFPSHFESLFVWLKNAFNGNMFNAPCAFETSDAAPPTLTSRHLKVLARFRHGREDMASGQLRLWGYHFQYMPIGLISAVYDRFLKEEAERQSTDGAFYTPMFLADMVVNQLWDELSDEQRISGVYCDPACGSGIFLVRLFQRLVAHHCRFNDRNYATWDELKSIARRLHGGDINSSAVRVAAFSLYIAMLEQSNPPDLPALLRAGKLLPSLYGDTLLPASDFFGTSVDHRYDAIIGNPPWKGRSGQITTAQTWSETRGYPLPAKDIAWGFVWKALDAVKDDGHVALLLPAMGVLHNTSGESQAARRLLLETSRVKRIINLSDLCFQLFDGAQRPTAFVLYSPVVQKEAPYRFEYWVPKADLNLRLKRLITLSRSDRIRFRSDVVIQDPTLFKRRLWTRGPEEKLLQYLRTIPPLSALVREFKDWGKGHNQIDRTLDWIIGQGFIPANDDRRNDTSYKLTTSETVTRYPYLDVSAFRPIGMRTIQESFWPTPEMYRAGFGEGFTAPHILIPQGIERATGRVRASYSEQSLVFRDSIQAITVPVTQKRKAKVLTAILNSTLAAWVYFHDTANFGVDRAKVHQRELLKLPFDDPQNMPDPKRAMIAEDLLVQLVDREIAKADEVLTNPSDVFAEVDRLTFEYYGLDQSDIVIIEDTLNYIVPAMQPRRSAGLQRIWANSSSEQRSDYASVLCNSLVPNFRQPVSATLVAKSSDAAILKLTISPSFESYSEKGSTDFSKYLESITAHLPFQLPGNVQVFPDLRFVIDSDMYLVKPLQVRYWLRSTALADAEQILAEFSAAAVRQSQYEADYAGW